MELLVIVRCRCSAHPLSLLLSAAAFVLAATSLRAQISVTPDGGSATVPLNSAEKTVTFLLYTGVSQNQTWHISLNCTGVVAGCWSPSGYDINVYHAKSVDIKFSTPTAGSGTIQLTATRFGFSDVGSYNVTVDGSPPTVTLLAPVGDVAVQFPTIQLAWCDNTSLNAASRSISVNGVNKTASFDYVGTTGCVARATSTTNTVALNVGSNQITAWICDNVNNCATPQNFFITRLGKGVAIRSELPERQGFAGSSGSQRFFVKNVRSVATDLTLDFQCSGSVSNCAVSPSSFASVPAGESRVVTLTYTVGAVGAGSGMVKAFDNMFRDSAAVAVTGINAPAPVVSVVAVNPGVAVERDLCLTIAAGSSAAFECGDLRIVHALPAIRTLNKARVPTLLYNSAAADPYPIVAASVTLPSVSGDSVQAVLKINGIERARGRWARSDWTAGATRRIALGYSALGDTTKVYGYTLEVAVLPDSMNPTVVSGKLIVVNRRGSAFGAGWWLAGLERLEFLPADSLLWVGGDGSARLYTPAGTNVWVAADVDRPDTLTRSGTRYSRRLPGGVTVQFNSAGQHDTTVNRLGHKTAFTDSSGFLTRIRLPMEGGGQIYTFTYDVDNRLRQVAAPGGRFVTIWTGALRVDSIRDVGGGRVRFSYESPSSKRISSRTDARGTVTSFSYDSAKKVWRVHVNLQPDSIRFGFRAIDVVGLATATPKTATDSANAYTSFFGSRQFTTGPDSVPQETKFWLDRYGAPRRTVNALGHQTVIKREEGQWPALATEIVVANGFTTRAGYDGRGNVVRSTGVQPLGPGQDAVTRYHWNPQWDFVDSIVTPSGVTTTMAYDGVTGNRLWQQVGSDPARRVTFWYNSLKLLSATVLPQTPADSIKYDSRGNVAATRTPKGFWTSYYKDALGRDTLIVTPIDSTDKQRGDAADSTIRLRQRVVYTALDQDSITESIAPNRVQTIRVEKLHDLEGNLISLARVGLPDTFGVGTITTQWRYDRANRRTVEVAVDGQIDSTDYDPAGNAAVVVTRRKHPISGTRLMMRMRYDALNRLVERVADSVAYPRDSVGVALYTFRTPLNRGFPYHPNNPQNGYTVFADTARFAYDSMGRDTVADNRDALVRRFYYPNGLLKTEILKVRTLAELGAGGNFDQHAYQTTYRYDLDGRRTVIKYPVQLAPALKDSTRFTYEAATGALADVWDPLENHFVYHYNLRGEMDTLRYASTPGGVFEARTYNEDGALVRHIVSGNRRDAAFKYDARQKVLRSENQFGAVDTLRAAYSGLGYLLNSQLSGWGETTTGGTGRAEAFDTLSYDALGNNIRTRSIRSQDLGGGSSSGVTNRLNFYGPETGRLDSVYDYAKAINVDILVYDSAGSTRGMWQKVAGTGGLENRITYYGADGSVRAADYRRFDGNPTSEGPNRFVFEEYRYDAYGRRVWVRARRECDGINSPNDDRPRGECRTDLVRRTVWDGFQELVEIQQPGGDTDPVENDTTPLHRGYPDGIDQNPFIGRVLYTYGAVLDQPLSLVRVAYADTFASTATPQPWFMWQPFSILPLWNYLGEVDRSLVGAGAPLCQLVNGVQRCVLGAWPFGWNALQVSGFAPYFWHGTVTENKRDKAQTLYRRYRLYDPLTGRFTQEDPIGLAGGLNLYGFANGDPVNFDDPFGLSTQCPDRPGGSVGTPSPSAKPSLLRRVGRFLRRWGGNVMLAWSALVDVKTLNEGADVTPTPIEQAPPSRELAPEQRPQPAGDRPKPGGSGSGSGGGAGGNSDPPRTRTTGGGGTVTNTTGTSTGPAGGTAPAPKPC